MNISSDGPNKYSLLSSSGKISLAFKMVVGKIIEINKNKTLIIFLVLFKLFLEILNTFCLYLNLFYHKRFENNYKNFNWMKKHIFHCKSFRE